MKNNIETNPMNFCGVQNQLPESQQPRSLQRTEGRN